MRNCKNILAVLCAVCMCAQPYFTSYAANGVGPGYEDEVEENTALKDGENTVSNAWTKVNGSYVDDSGNVIEGAILRGVSVSKWQGDIDWAKVAKDDVSFAWIRMGSFGYEGEYTMDEYFDKNMREASANGIAVAPYVYLQTKTVEEAREAAAFAVETAGKYNVAYPLAVDIESQYILELSVQELTDVVNAFCQVVEAAGYTPIVYSDRSKFTSEMDTEQIPYDIWFARYGSDNYYKNRTIWQSTDKGQISGISTNVCLEFAYVDYGSSAGRAGASFAGNTELSGEWKQIRGSWYYEQGGGRITGWIQNGGNWYYCDPGNMGAMAVNTTLMIDGAAYTFDANGVMR